MMIFLNKHKLIDKSVYIVKKTTWRKAIKWLFFIYIIVFWKSD